MRDAEHNTTPRPRPRPGRRPFVLAVLLAGGLLVVALAFPFVWSIASGNPLGGTLGRLTSGLTSGAVTSSAVLTPYATPGAAPVATSQVNWPAGESILEKWNARTPGQGTIFGYYMTTSAAAGYQWSEGIAYPIPSELGGDGFRVLIVEWPRGNDPSAPPEMHITTGRLYTQPNGDLLPQAESWVGGCVLTAAQARWVAANGVPDGLTKEIVLAADHALLTGNPYQYANSPTTVDPARHIPADDIKSDGGP